MTRRSKRKDTLIVLNFCNLIFEFVPDFGFRYSNFSATAEGWAKV
jgi:hypothetical protein